jgi:ribosomal protein S1
MKKTIAIVLSLILMFAFTAVTFAAGKKAAKAKTATVTGEVTAVDATANTLTVKGKKGEVTITVDDKTKLPKGKTLADIKQGDNVTVKYSEVEGKNTAKSVAMKAAPMKKGEKKEKKEAAPMEKKEATPTPAKKAPGY